MGVRSEHYVRTCILIYTRFQCPALAVYLQQAREVVEGKEENSRIKEFVEGICGC